MAEHTHLPPSHACNALSTANGYAENHRHLFSNFWLLSTLCLSSRPPIGDLTKEALQSFSTATCNHQTVNLQPTRLSYLLLLGPVSHSTAPIQQGDVIKTFSTDGIFPTPPGLDQATGYTGCSASCFPWTNFMDTSEFCPEEVGAEG